MSEAAKWYVVHTYSGYENKVADDLNTFVENRGLHDLIHQISVPMETVEEVTDSGEVKQVERKVFPGYVLVKMVMTNDSWYVVRNIRGVTGFVGPESKPVPLTPEEVTRLGVERHTKRALDYQVGDVVSIIDGPLEGMEGAVTEIDADANRVKVTVSMFGRDTAAELSTGQVKKIG